MIVVEPLEVGKMKRCFLMFLLTLIAPLLTFAQEPLRVEGVKALRLKAAESDAKKDANKDMRKPAPFITGMGSAFATGTCLVMTFRTLPFIEPSLGCCAFAAAGVSPFFLMLVKHYNTPPHPSIERLIGKHPE